MGTDISDLVEEDEDDGHNEGIQDSGEDDGHNEGLQDSGDTRIPETPLS
jgi:hypothetical protein